MTFTAPFDVEKIWVVETYDEASLANTAIKTTTDDNGKTTSLTKRESVLLEQARHNADFAAFFGVAMALGSSDSFDKIFQDWLDWGKLKDMEAPEEGGTPLYSGTGDYTLRGRYPLTPYDGSNWYNANFYLNRHDVNWKVSQDNAFGFVSKNEDDDPNTPNPLWVTPTKADNEDGVLLDKGKTYSLLFPWCVGCWEQDKKTLAYYREKWDYWSGKFLIFEGKAGNQTINGSDFVAEGGGVFAAESGLEYNEAAVLGNSTFSFMNTSKDNVYIYTPDINNEAFLPVGEEDIIMPTTAFLVTKEQLTSPQGMPARRISREGEIDYGVGSDDNDGPITGDSHIPTINGGSDIFVTSIAEGINIAVSEPQAVGVFSATGQLIYSGWVETSVDVNLVVDGVYVVVGENESMKVIY